MYSSVFGGSTPLIQRNQLQPVEKGGEPAEKARTAATHGVSLGVTDISVDGVPAPEHQGEARIECHPCAVDLSLGSQMASGPRYAPTGVPFGS